MPLQFLGKGKMAIEKKKIIPKKEEFINLQAKVYSKFYVLNHIHKNCYVILV